MYDPAGTFRTTKQEANATNRIREYQARVKATLLDADGKPLFNYQYDY
jgi:hypothetical protein